MSEEDAVTDSEDTGQALSHLLPDWALSNKEPGAISPAPPEHQANRILNPNPDEILKLYASGQVP